MTTRLMLGDVRKNDVLVADDGFTCLPAGRHTVHDDEDGRGPWMACWCGRHYLDGQTAFDEKDRLVGLRRATLP